MAEYKKAVRDANDSANTIYTGDTDAAAERNRRWLDSQAALDRMRKTGTVLYIHTPLKDILKRLNNIKSRGVTLAPGQTLENLYEERSPLYAARCDIELDAAGLSVEGTVDAIIEALRAHGRF